MQLFLHNSEKIRIINGVQEFACTPEEFVDIEPTYPGLPEGAILRYWTPEQSYISDGNTQTPDLLDCLPFILQIATYTQENPCIYAHVTLSKTVLFVDGPDVIIFSAALKATPNPADSNLPVTQSWIIRLRHECGSVADSFLAEFVAGACEYEYLYRAGLPLGDYYLSANDFNPVTVNGETYQVRLVNPVIFTLFRILA
jgi:hypothetical protein